MTVDFITPVARIVWGNPGKATIKKDQKTKQPIIRDGKEVEQWVFGLAFPKVEFEQQVWPYMQQEALSLFPNGVPSGFSWKYKDGDGVDKKGRRYADREGYAGCYVLTVSTEAFQPPIFKNENGQFRQMDGGEIKTGDYVVASLSLKANQPTNATHTPGIYVNPVGINHVGYGQEIVTSGADPDELFGNQQYQLPAGASATPVAPTNNFAPPYQQAQPAGMPAPAQAMPQPSYTPQMPAINPAPNGAPTPAAYGQPQPAGNVPVAAPLPAAVSNAPANYQQPQPTGMPQPAYDFVQNAGQPAAMPAPSQAMPQPAGMPGMPTGR